jgi:lipopolysaccharide export system permease protein
MLLKSYQKYIITVFFKNLLIVGVIFFTLIFFLNVLEEVKFFDNLNKNLSYPILLTLLNSPSIIFEIFPFIVLISTQILFMNFYEKDELTIFKNYGVSNFKIINIILIVSFIFGFFLSSIFYTFSSNLKYTYLSLKNKFTNDNKYLAVVNENGLWIKDEINNYTYITNAEIFYKNILEKVTITQLDKNFNLIQTIVSDSVNIENKLWVLRKPKIFDQEGKNTEHDEMFFESNFDRSKINSLFSNLSSLNIVQLINLKNDYKMLGYSTLEVESQMHKIFSTPLYSMIMTAIGAILMLNIKYNKSKIFNIVLGILISVLIYYINYFFNLLGTNQKIPIIISIWLPYIMLILICMIGIVKINEK